MNEGFPEVKDNHKKGYKKSDNRPPRKLNKRKTYNASAPEDSQYKEGFFERESSRKFIACSLTKIHESKSETKERSKVRSKIDAE